MITIPYVNKKITNSPSDVPFGGAIPTTLKAEFDALARAAGWQKKRLLAAAVFGLIKAAKSGNNVGASDAAKLYGDVGVYYDANSSPATPTQADVDAARQEMEKMQEDARANQPGGAGKPPGIEVVETLGATNKPLRKTREQVLARRRGRVA